MANKNLTAAKKAKNDEFYTQFEDIQKELTHYKDHFKDKIIFCNCDDPTWSNFWRYFHLNFEFFGIKKLIATHYDATQSTYKMEYTGGDDTNFEAGVVTPLMQNGDFRSPECVELLKEADIVVTNPMFSLFRQYVAQLIEYKKKFVIMGNMNAVTYKEFFPLLKDNEVWAGYSFNKTLVFAVPDTYDTSKSIGQDEFGRKLVRVPAICWFTNLDIPKRHEEIKLTEKYDPERYPQYENYQGINVDKVTDIPKDYFPCWYECPHVDECVYAKTEEKEDNALCEQSCNGEMGVPISFMDKHNTEQFEILGNAGSYSGDGSVADELFVSDSCGLPDEEKRREEKRREEKRRDAKCTRESSFAGRRKCNGIIGVPISYTDKHCCEKFRIIWQASGNTRASTDRTILKELGYIENRNDRGGCTVIHGKRTYGRIFI